MKTITGTVTCSVENSKINPNAEIIVEIRDVALMCAPSKLLAQTKLSGKSTFPFEFKIEFDETPMLGKPPHFFAISTRIQTAETALDYIDDTRFTIIGNDGQVLDHINMFVVPVTRFE